MLRFITVLVLLPWAAVPAFGLGQDQLYTGTAATVPPGQVQFQLFGSTTFSKAAKLAGTSFTFGATRNFDVKLAYSYLWNFQRPDVQIGPNIGAKWRFVGDGKAKPSVSMSFLYANSEIGGGVGSSNNAGSLLIVQHPIGPLIFLGNFGRVWSGNHGADARYVALALARVVSPKVLAAAQYIELAPLGTGSTRRAYVAAVVLRSNPKTGCSLQIGYTPETPSKWNATLGVSQYF